MIYSENVCADKSSFNLLQQLFAIIKFYFTFKESLQDFPNHNHQSLIDVLKDFPEGSIYEWFEAEYRCSVKLSVCFRVIDLELGEAVSNLIRPPDRNRLNRIRNLHLTRLAIACRNAARDCRRYIRIIEWMAAEPTDGLDSEFVERRLREITEELPVPEFEY